MIKKKHCYFCTEKIGYIDYKNLPLLRRFMLHIRIQPRYYTGVCLIHQKKVAHAIKNARFIGLLPYVKKPY